MVKKTSSISRENIREILEDLNKQNTRRNSPKYEVTENIIDRIQRAVAKYERGLREKEFISERPQRITRLKKLKKTADSLIDQIKKSSEDMALLSHVDFTRGLTEHLNRLIEHANYNLKTKRYPGLDKNPPGAPAKFAYHCFIDDLANIHETATEEKPGKPYRIIKAVYGGPFFEFVSKILTIVDGTKPHPPTLNNSIKMVLDSIK